MVSARRRGFRKGSLCEAKALSSVVRVMTKSNDSSEKKATDQKAKDQKAAESQVFAVVRTCGKQYRVMPGSRISIDQHEGNPGDTVTFTDVVMAGTTGGSDVKVLSGEEKTLGVTVTGKLLNHKKDKKVIIFKKRLKGGYTKKQGHRQAKSEVLIESVAL